MHYCWTFVERDARRGAMSDISVSILPETADDAVAIERLHERTFGPGRYAKSAYRLREQIDHIRELSFTAWIGTLLIGSVWLSAIRIGDTKALLLGPLTVEPAFRERGVGQALIERALKEAAQKGHRLVVLVGDEAYYEKCGFKHIPRGRAIMPGPVDPARLLIAELSAGAFDGVSGPVRPD
jgi:predicted N-acetyltransferase YhbS